MAGPVAPCAVAADTHRPWQRFRFQPATESDDAALHRLLRLTPMDGHIRVTLRREPSFFRAAAVEGPEHHVLTVRDTRSGQLVGMGSASVRSRYVDGQPVPVGYLSGLRLMPEFRRGTLLARGFRELRKWHQRHSQAKFYLTTIADNNRMGLEALTRKRADLPAYRHAGTYHTLVLPLRRQRHRDPPAGYHVRPLRHDELPCLVEFLNRVGRGRQFFPCYRIEDFQGEWATFLNLPPERILAAWRGSQLVATLGAWDQSPFRQTVVEGYSPRLAWMRPAYNLWAAWRGRPRFPSVGKPFRCLAAAVPLVGDADPQVFQALLDHLAYVVDDTACDSLLLGVGPQDPLFDMVSRRAAFRYITHLYLVSWEGFGACAESFDDRDFYLELGCL